MRLSEKKAWARTCGVAWFVCHRFACAGGGVAWHAGGVPCARPCRKSSQDSRQMARMRANGAFDLDCAADYSQACPKHHVLKGGLCIAREGCVCLQVRSNRNEQNLSLNFGGLFFGCVEEDFCRHMINTSFIPILQDFSRSTRKNHTL